MRAIQVNDSTPERDLRVVDVSMPSCSEEEVLINVHAAGVNRADLMQRDGKYPPPPGESPILGLEVAGVVERVGAHVVDFARGERVCALLAGGGYAECVAVNAGQVMKLPAVLSFDEGAGLPEAFITAFTNLFVEGQLQSGETVLIHGGSSGVGTAAIQLAKSAGAQVACTVANETKAAACRKLGADCVALYGSEDFEKVVRSWSANGINVILDCVGGGYLARNVALLAPHGRLVLIASMGGASGQLDIPTLMKKRGKIIGSVLRSRSSQEKSALVGKFRNQFLDRFASGELRVVVDSVFPLAKAVDAHQRMKSSEHVGKIILTVR